MKNTFKKLLAALVLTALAAPSFAIKYTDADLTVSSITTYEIGVLIQLQTTGSNQNFCTLGTADTLVFMRTTTVSQRTMLASLLAAHVSNKPITLGLDGCLNWGPGTIPEVYRVAF